MNKNPILEQLKREALYAQRSFVHGAIVSDLWKRTDGKAA